MPSPYFTSADVDAIWTKDINPGAASNLAYTSLFSIFTNVNEIKTDVDGLVTAVSTLGADMAYLKSKLDELTEDPAVTGHSHPIVAAVEWADAN